MICNQRCAPLLLAVIAPNLSAQTATVTYSGSLAIPAIGNAAAVALACIVLAIATRSLHRNGAQKRKSLVLSASLALVTVAGSGTWLINNNQAVAAAAALLLSTNPSPVAVTSFPATLQNDLELPVTIRSVAVSGCAGPTAVTGTCMPGAEVITGGSCSIDSVCQGTCGNNMVEAGEEFDPPPGQFTTAAGPNCRYDFSAVSQFYCNGTCSISGPTGCDQTEADRFCRLKTDNPASVASSFTVTTALDEPGFSCATLGLGTVIDMSSRGVNELVGYQDTSILDNHGSGNVIVNADCTVPD